MDPVPCTTPTIGAIMTFDPHHVMARLAVQRTIFHSEADFQHALAWQIQCEHPDARVRLHTRPTREIRLDLLVHLDGVRIAIELKHLAAAFSGVVAGENFELLNQAAQDIARHDVIKDVVRLERLVADGLADVGWSVTLSNDHTFWRPARKVDPIDAAFRLHEGRQLSGTLGWAANAGKGTTVKRDVPHVLAGHYQCNWRDYSTVIDSSGRPRDFRYLCFAVAGVPRVPGSRLAETPVVAPAPRLTAVTARDEILEAARTLANRSADKTFSVHEIVDQLRRQGSRYAENTVRTHVVSRMCVNAPDHHATVFADLERVGAGRYRLV